MKAAVVRIIPAAVGWELRKLLSGLYFSKIPFQMTEIYWRLQAVLTDTRVANSSRNDPQTNTGKQQSSEDTAEALGPVPGGWVGMSSASDRKAGKPPEAGGAHLQQQHSRWPIVARPGPPRPSPPKGKTQSGTSNKRAGGVEMA